ncbi:hypothetical protein LEP1GSC052_4247 [Leptospira kmetyi serovar Malaysia str. Bejo-Iso9]|nr:hypothetical protein LEP1GSC052_4247 [Leptospira kmetyi serovar Malaysia str. Bejo-Iso9]
MEPVFRVVFLGQIKKPERVFSSFLRIISFSFRTSFRKRVLNTSGLPKM